MDEKAKLILALQQVNNLTTLLQGNEWEAYIYNRLITIKCELERQLTNVTHQPKI